MEAQTSIVILIIKLMLICTICSREWRAAEIIIAIVGVAIGTEETIKFIAKLVFQASPITLATIPVAIVIATVSRVWLDVEPFGGLVRTGDCRYRVAKTLTPGTVILLVTI
jgi:hypothetical protein